jgi:hypothetical protein
MSVAVIEDKGPAVPKQIRQKLGEAGFRFSTVVTFPNFTYEVKRLAVDGAGNRDDVLKAMQDELLNALEGMPFKFEPMAAYYQDTSSDGQTPAMDVVRIKRVKPVQETQVSELPVSEAEVAEA